MHDLVEMFKWEADKQVVYCSVRETVAAIRVTLLTSHWASIHFTWVGNARLE